MSELFPISSLGHSVILPSLFGWNIHQNEPYFLTFLVALHLATALVLLGFFWQDWVRIVKGLGRSLRDREITDPDAKLGWLLVLGTIPAGILGLLLQDSLRKLFASPEYASIFLACNGLLLFGAEALRRRAPVVAEDDDERIAKTVGWWQASTVGGAQAIALIPGFSRSGAAMGGGLLVGLSHKDAARFAFLLATPIILAAAVLKLPDLAGSQGERRPRTCTRRCSLLGAERLPRGALPDEVLRDADVDPVRGLLPLRRHGLRHLLRGHLEAAMALGEVAQPPGQRGRQCTALEPPAPVSLRLAGPVHPRVAAEAEHVLGRRRSRARRGRSTRARSGPSAARADRGRWPPVRAAEAREPTGSGVGVVRARVRDRVGAMVLEQCGLRRRRRNAHKSTTIPGSPSSSRSRVDRRRDVRRGPPRSLAGRRALRATASKSSAPGPGRQRPRFAVVFRSGIAQ